MMHCQQNTKLEGLDHVLSAHAQAFVKGGLHSEFAHVAVALYAHVCIPVQ